MLYPHTLPILHPNKQAVFQRHLLIRTRGYLRYTDSKVTQSAAKTYGATYIGIMRTAAMQLPPAAVTSI